MRILKGELRLRLKNRKARPFSRAGSADDANDIGGACVDSAISSPSTPNSSLSSQSNLIGTPSPNTPSPATPTQPNTPITPCGGTTGSGHKNSLKGTKLARRARSFKDDLFEKISLMRTPNNTLGRSHSPHSPRNRSISNKPPPTAEEVAKSSQTLETHVKDISNALKHFRDVIVKKKLEVVPGNGTVILETIASMFAVIQSYMLNESSTVLISATEQVYQSLGRLIKLCDEVMLNSENDECASLSEENVKEVVDLLENAVKNLVTLAQQKLKEKEENAFKYGPNNNEVAATAISHNHLMRPPCVEVAGQRTSLPDITLTPKERDILEKTKSNPIRASHSTESILRDTSPPPKPPLPNRESNPPPLPPKRRSQQMQHPNHHLSNNLSINSDLDCSHIYSLNNFNVDNCNLSVRSRSPDENSSQCSLDSALNHSREEEELKALGLEGRLDEHILEDDVEEMFAFSGDNKGTVNTTTTTATITNKDNVDGLVGSNICTGVGINSIVPAAGAASIAAGIQNVAAATVMAIAATKNGNNISDEGSNTATSADKAELRTAENNRHSNESGYVSMKSFRTSNQSVSKRSSDYSFQSSTKSSNPEIACGLFETQTLANNEFSVLQQQQTQTTTTSSSTTTMMFSSNSVEHQQQQFGSTKTFTTTSTSSSSSSKLGMMITTTAAAATSDDNQQRSPSSVSPDYKMLLKANSLDANALKLNVDDGDDDLAPPALPPKRNKERKISQYDNFDEIDDVNNKHELPEMRQHYHAYYYHRQQNPFQLQAKHQSLIEPRTVARSGFAGSCNAIGIDGNAEEPPPLPMKKRHILAYMEICSASTRSIEQYQQNRYTVCADNLNRNITHSQTMNIVPFAKDLTSPEHESPQPPARPPKSYKQRKPPTTTPTIITTPPPSPKPTHLNAADQYNLHGDGSGAGARHTRLLSNAQGNELMSTVCEEISDLNEDDQINLHHSCNLPNEEEDASADADRNKSPTNGSSNRGAIRTPINTPEITNEDDAEGIDVALENHNNYNNKKNQNSVNSINNDSDIPDNLLEEIDITPYLILKKENEDGPDVKGGYTDALIVHASRIQKVTDNAFSEAFIATFRTFIQPIDLIEKLTHRYTVFFCQMNDQKQKAAKETFSLLVRVVNDLASTDLTNQLLTLLLGFEFQLVCSGQLYMAKLLRNKIVEKVTVYKEQKLPVLPPLMHITYTNQPSLLDLKSSEIAEQMTLLDAELFQKIEIPEVLVFAKEQCEEKSPNLNKFTEHFNKMSYWARSKILMLQDAKEREKHVIKFIKIMKYLRKMNNYNSYLALLSALDSAPIRRLDWHKTTTEGLKEYSMLIESSSSFRIYRQALAETNPPCIPYIGIVLQDLTFVHHGNPDYLRKGVVNFSKRWTQYSIIVNMKRFKKCAYPFKRNDRIIQFFENFENFLGEEEMWQISETIKPRGKRIAVQN